MLDFEKLIVYQKAKLYYRDVEDELLNKKDLDRIVKDQLKRASLSIVLNIAEGCSRFSNPDRRKFLVIARGSVFECVAIFDLMKGSNAIELDSCDKFYTKAEEISKMLYAMIKKIE